MPTLTHINQVPIEHESLFANEEEKLDGNEEIQARIGELIVPNHALTPNATTPHTDARRLLQRAQADAAAGRDASPAGGANRTHCQ